MSNHHRLKKQSSNDSGAMHAYVLRAQKENGKTGWKTSDLKRDKEGNPIYPINIIEKVV